MFLRIDRLAIPLPEPPYTDPNAAAAVQELLGGRFGEMSTLMNYTMQSFNFRRKKRLKPFYDLVANITAEELAHVELVANTINLVLSGSSEDAPPKETPLREGKDVRNTHHYIVNAQTALVQDSMGRPWTGDYVFNGGNLVLDLLHNFFLECGARTHKMRVYEMTDHPTAREMIGYLLVRGGVHIVAYARALEILTGTNITKMFPVPSLSNQAFPETHKYEAQGIHRKIYRFSPRDYRDIELIFHGPHPEDGKPLEVVDRIPKGGKVPDFEDLPEEFAPGISSEEAMWLYHKLMT